MNLPISSPDSTRSGTRWTPPSVTQAAGADDIRVAHTMPLASVAVGSEASTRGRRYSTQLNEQLTSAQRALGFIDRLACELEKLKADLSRELTRRRVDQQGLEAKVNQFAEQWEQHQAQSGGSVDHKLRFCLAADARQNFTMRGIDLASLVGGEAETLVFFTKNAHSASPLSINVGSGSNEADILRAFKRAFAPLGITTSVSDNGELNFAVSEANWPMVRDHLSVCGGGIRFPSGQPRPVHIDAEQDAFSVREWEVNEHSAVRQTLQRVVRAQGQLQQVRGTIIRAIDEVSRSIQQLARMDENSWANGFVADFNARFNQPAGYRESYDIIPALLGISRYRVLSLLSL